MGNPWFYLCPHLGQVNWSWLLEEVWLEIFTLVQGHSRVGPFIGFCHCHHPAAGLHKGSLISMATDTSALVPSSTFLLSKQFCRQFTDRVTHMVEDAWLPSQYTGSIALDYQMSKNSFRDHLFSAFTQVILLLFPNQLVESQHLPLWGACLS